MPFGLVRVSFVKLRTVQAHPVNYLFYCSDYQFAVRDRNLYEFGGLEPSFL